MRRAWPLVVVLLAGCATFRTLFQEEHPPFVPTGAKHLSGAYSRAIGVAYEDWMTDRARQKVEREAYEDAGDGGPRFHPEVRATQECLDTPAGYETWAWLDDAGTSYHVYILGQEGVCSPPHEDGPYYGDYLTYEIDATTFQILKKEVQE